MRTALVITDSYNAGIPLNYITIIKLSDGSDRNPSFQLNGLENGWRTLMPWCGNPPIPVSACSGSDFPSNAFYM